MNNGQDDVCICPSFNSYSSDRSAEIAARVAGDRSTDAVRSEDNGSDDQFEFAFVREREEFSAYECQIGPVFPVFNRDLLLKDGGEFNTSAENEQSEPESSVVISLSQLFIEEDKGCDYPPSCSSSEADELDSIPAGDYCVWRPRMADPPLQSQCRKSKSTGFGSKRWKLRDLMRRSKSDGKESFVFLTPKHREEKTDKLIQSAKKSVGKESRSAAAATASGAAASAHEAFYVQNRAMKEGDKKRSYLPYRQGLVGFFANVNGVHRSFPHF